MDNTGKIKLKSTQILQRYRRMNENTINMKTHRGREITAIRNSDIQWEFLPDNYYLRTIFKILNFDEEFKILTKSDKHI